jgi:transcriptional repressor NrdR
LLRAVEKRPVASEAIDAAVVHVCNKLRAMGEREVPSRTVGELVMEELHDLDEVAYVRFASVYRSFQDVDAFREEIDRMRHRRTKQETENQLALWVSTEKRKKR